MARPHSSESDARTLGDTHPTLLPDATDAQPA